MLLLKWKYFSLETFKKCLTHHCSHRSISRAVTTAMTLGLSPRERQPTWLMQILVKQFSFYNFFSFPFFIIVSHIVLQCLPNDNIARLGVLKSENVTFDRFMASEINSFLKLFMLLIPRRLANIWSP